MLMNSHDTAVQGGILTQGQKVVPQRVYHQGGRQKTDANRPNVGKYKETTRGKYTFSD